MNEIAERRAPRERRLSNQGPSGDGVERRRAERRVVSVDEGPVTQVAERRMLRERRQRDSGPPSGCSDRRRAIERRLPPVEERAISDAEWQTYFGATV